MRRLALPRLDLLLFWYFAGTWLLGWLVRVLCSRISHSLMLVALLLLVACQERALAADQVPRAAQQYQRLLIRSAHSHWGLDAPIATMAAQVHQESAWRPDARSPVGAMGLAQFMPGTADWFAGLYPAQLGENTPYNPAWSLRALVLYDRWLYARVRGVTNCERWAFVLASYNGGLGWVQRDQRLAVAAGDNPAVWFGSVERYTSRADWARRENRHYVRVILHRWEPLYVRAGWGHGVCR